MTLLEAILKLLGDAATTMPSMEKVLMDIEAKYPDTKAMLDPIVAALGTAISPDNLASLGAAIPGELLNIVKLKLDGKPHPGDGF